MSICLSDAVDNFKIMHGLVDPLATSVGALQTTLDTFTRTLASTYPSAQAPNASLVIAIGTTIANVSASTGVDTLGPVVHGVLYTPGTYYNVELTGGAVGSGGATANITVGVTGVVTVATLVKRGGGYVIGNVLSAAAANIGGTGSGFTVPVSTITPGNMYAYLNGSSGIIHNISTVLPLMNANDDIDKKLKKSKGTTYDAIVPGSDLAAAISPIIDVIPTIAALNAALSSGTNQAALFTGAVAEFTAATTTILTTNTSVNTTVTNSLTNSPAAIIGVGGPALTSVTSLSTIRAYALASFINASILPLTGYISGTTLTVAAGTITPPFRLLRGVGVVPGTTIVNQITPLTSGESLGKIGRYVVSISQTVPLTAMTTFPIVLDSILNPAPPYTL